jgi:hypothetical protein
VMTETELALRAAINVLRDTIESGRMPSRMKLTPDAAALHERAARHLEAMLQRTGSALTPVREAYAKGWEDACSLAIARFNAFTECTFLATEAISELQRLVETGAHHPENRADG